MNITLRLLSAALLCLVAESQVMAEGETAANPSGLWSWESTGFGQTRVSTMSLKMEDGKLKGSVTSRGNTSQIEDAKLEGSQISFVVIRAGGNFKFTNTYQGVIEGDQIKGTMEGSFRGGGGNNNNRPPQKQDWNAQRGHLISGGWKYGATTGTGQIVEPSLRFKQEGGVITGKLIFNGNEAEITDGSLKGDELTFKVKRERDGQLFTSQYFGKIKDEVIRGKIESNYGGYEKTQEFEARRLQ